MPPPHEEPENLQIRCPACGQRFKVGVDLRERMVECGSCEHRFRIDDDTILRTKKFYPGERRDVRLDSFARVPHAPAVQPNIRMAQYAAEPSKASFEPPSPLRVIAAATGVCAMIGMALLLFFGATPDGALGGVPVIQRFALAGFAAVIGSAMLIYGNPRGRKKAVLVAVVFTAILMSLPAFYQGGSEVVKDKAPAAGSPGIRQEKTAAEKSAELGRTIGIGPLKDENERLAGIGAPPAFGVWLRNLKLQTKNQVNDYLIRSTGADVNNSHLYLRDPDAGLMILSGTRLSLDEVAVAASKLGHDSDSITLHPELGLVEVVMDNTAFQEGDFAKLQDKNSPSFYDLNRRELNSIDLDRVKSAIKRIGNAEPKVYRDDITRQLILLIRDADAPMLGDISQALGTWAQPDDAKATEAVTAAFQKMSGAGIPPTRETMIFLVSRHAVTIAPALDQMWAGDPPKWEQIYGDLGPVIEPLVLAHLQESKGFQLRQSAARLLGKVGGEKSLAALAATNTGNDNELKLIVEKSIAAIKERK